jgi:hypothetical protein
MRRPSSGSSLTAPGRSSGPRRRGTRCGLTLQVAAARMERSNQVRAIIGMPGSSSLFRASDLVEVVVDEADGHGALADGRGHPFDRAAAHVAGGEHASAAGLQRQRPAARLPRLADPMLASSTEESEVLDPWVTRMRSLPATVVSTTLEEPLDWPDARRPHPRAHLPTHPACLSPSMHPCNGPPSTDWRTIKNMRAAIEREQDE